MYNISRAWRKPTLLILLKWHTIYTLTPSSAIGHGHCGYLRCNELSCKIFRPPHRAVYIYIPTLYQLIYDNIYINIPTRVVYIICILQLRVRFLEYRLPTRVGPAYRGGGSAIISAAINPTVEFLIEDLNRRYIYLFFFSLFPVLGPPLAITASAVGIYRCRVINFNRHRIIYW